MKVGALSLLSVTVRMTFAFPDNPSPPMSAARTSKVYLGYFCWKRHKVSLAYQLKGLNVSPSFHIFSWSKISEEISPFTTKFQIAVPDVFICLKKTWMLHTHLQHSITVDQYNWKFHGRDPRLSPLQYSTKS